MGETDILFRLADTDLTVANEADDVRGMTVVDRGGDEIGEVDDLVIDEEERKVRLLQVIFGGFLGMGKQKFLVPVDAVTGVDDMVRIDTDREHVANSPVYDPDLVIQQETIAGLYGHYGMLPYWYSGYQTPGFPFR
jgi:sporulation protein YlmC with PRC-barrel domain